MARRRNAVLAPPETGWFEEIAVVIALALIVGGTWPWLGCAALTVPGLVLLWVVLPARKPFIEPSRPDESPRRAT